MVYIYNTLVMKSINVSAETEVQHHGMDATTMKTLKHYTLNNLVNRKEIIIKIISLT